MQYYQSPLLAYVLTSENQYLPRIPIPLVHQNADPVQRIKLQTRSKLDAHHALQASVVSVAPLVKILAVPEISFRDMAQATSLVQLAQRDWDSITAQIQAQVRYSRACLTSSFEHVTVCRFLLFIFLSVCLSICLSSLRCVS